MSLKCIPQFAHRIKVLNRLQTQPKNNRAFTLRSGMVSYRNKRFKYERHSVNIEETFPLMGQFNRACNDHLTQYFDDQYI